MTFRVGQKVVYVGGLRIDLCEGLIPTKGNIYTISWIGPIERYNCIHIDLIECPSPETSTTYRGYDQRAFRPVVERKTDISIFKEILRKVSNKQEIDA
jgi:hypothetical protein